MCTMVHWCGGYGLPLEFLSGFPSEGLDVLARSSRAHCADIVGAEGLFDGTDGGAVAGDHEGTAGLSTGEAWADWSRSMNVVSLMIIVDRRRRRGARRGALDAGRMDHTLTVVAVLLIHIHGVHGAQDGSSASLKAGKWKG